MLNPFLPIRVVLSFVLLLPAFSAAQVVHNRVSPDPQHPVVLFSGESLPFTSFQIGDQDVESATATPATCIALPETDEVANEAAVEAGSIGSCTVDSCTAEPGTADSCTATSHGDGDGSKKCGAACGGGSLFNFFYCKSADFDDPCAKASAKLHYWNDYSYLDDPEYSGHCKGDRLKRLGKDWQGCGCIGAENPSESWIDIGGRFRLRYHNERGLGRQAGSILLDDNETNHGLSQIRLFGDWHINNDTRIFAEGIYADTAGSSEGYIPRGNERNRGDFLNLFIDMKIAEHTTVRFGRQQLLYGSRRLIAGPGWANTSRSHDGIKIIQKFDKFRLDTFYTQTVTVSVDDFDEIDFERTLFGTWATYKGTRDTLDAYYLGFDDDRPGNERIIHTIGGRLSGGERWLYDIEGAGQFGRQTALGLDHAAAFATAGVGRKLEGLPWSPVLWAYFDYASGDAGDGAFNRFNPIFNRAHHYLGFIDLAQRTNLEIPSLELTLNPTKRFRILARYFHIMSNSETDEIEAGGGGLRAPQNQFSNDFGDTVDIAGYYKLTPRSNTRFGYSHFWSGNKVISGDEAAFAYAEWATWF